MTCLVFGSDGQVGRHLRELMHGARFWTRRELDLSAPDDLVDRIVDARPSFIINLAAYTAVDRAETEPELAWQVNAQAPAAMATAARRLGVGLVHVSTDYVFDGGSTAPYTEDSGLSPVNVYGRTKLAGEMAVAAIAPAHWILRTSWVFSEHGSNFVKTMLRLGRERSTLSVVDDQRGCPTYAGDLAAVVEALSRLSSSVPVGTHHVPGGVEVSWCEFARAIFREAAAAGLLAKPPEVLSISTSDYPTPARRPARSTLAASPILEAQLGVSPDWARGLRETLARLTTGP